jgi:hypothetical protein
MRSAVVTFCFASLLAAASAGHFSGKSKASLTTPSRHRDARARRAVDLTACSQAANDFGACASTIFSGGWSCSECATLNEAFYQHCGGVSAFTAMENLINLGNSQQLSSAVVNTVMETIGECPDTLYSYLVLIMRSL